MLPESGDPAKHEETWTSTPNEMQFQTPMAHRKQALGFHSGIVTVMALNSLSPRERVRVREKLTPGRFQQDFNP